MTVRALKVSSIRDTKWDSNILQVQTRSIYIATKLDGQNDVMITNELQNVSRLSARSENDKAMLARHF